MARRAGEVPPSQKPSAAGRPGAWTGPRTPALGKRRVPGSSSPRPCPLWGVRWVTSPERCDSGQSVPLINLISFCWHQAVARGPAASLRLPIPAGRREREELAELTPEPGWARSALAARILGVSRRDYHRFPPILQIRKPSQCGEAHGPRPHN